MRNLILAFLVSFLFFEVSLKAQSPSVSALSFSLDNYGLYNNWHIQNDTFFVIPIKMDTFVAGIDSFAFNITYDAAVLTPIMDLTAINDPAFILLMNYLGGAEFSMVDGQTIKVDTFDMAMSNTNYMLSVSYKASTVFTQGIYNNCWGTIVYIAFKRKDMCQGSFNFNFNFVAGNNINPNQPNTFLLSGSQNHSVDNGTLTANNGQLTKQDLEAIINQNGVNLESTVSYGVAPYVFLWSTGEITQNITPIGSGPWYVIVEDAHGCIDTSNSVSVLGIEQEILLQHRQLQGVYDILGQETSLKNNKILLYIYNDRTYQRRIILE